MALEIPFSLIRKFQTVVRNEAGVPDYDPDDPSLHVCPTLHEAIAALDPSTPPYLRCKNCQAKLSRGIQSMICVFCGADRRRDGLSHTISFNSTVACRNFLQSLDLDGSEPVGLESDSRVSSKDRVALKDGLVLSELLDLELTWPLDKEVQISSMSKVPAQSSQSLNLSGVDLDNFFSEKKDLESPGAVIFSQDVLQKGHIISPETQLSSDSGSFDVFGSSLSVKKAEKSTETNTSDFSDSFADWEADFQSADSVESFQGSMPYALNNQSHRELDFHGGGNKQQHSSINDDWIPDDDWHTADIKIADTAGQLKNNNMPIIGGNKSNDFLPVSKPNEDINVPNVNEKNDDGNDSFDVWKDFASLQDAPKASSDSWAQLGEKGVLSSEDSHKMSSLNQSDSLEEMEFGNFLQSGHSGLTVVKNDATHEDNLTGPLEDTEFGTFLQSGPSSGVTAVKNDATDNDNLTDTLDDMEFGSFVQSGSLGITEDKNDLTVKGSLTETIEEIEFGSFLKSDASSGTTAFSHDPINQEGNSQVHDTHPDRMNPTTGTIVLDDMNEDSIAAVKGETAHPSVEALLSQMHDLSFMLENKLAIPQGPNSGSAS